MRHFLLCLLLLSGLAPRADAMTRASFSIGDYIRESPLVIVADIATTTAPSSQTILTVREVLKRDESAPLVRGGRLAFPITRMMWDVPAQASNVVVVMSPSWKAPPTDASRAISAVYQTPEQIAAARALVQVYEKPDERARLLALQQVALQEVAGPGNKYLGEQLFVDLGRMRNRDNFGIALDSYPRLESVEDRARLVRLLGTIGDARALPLLIGALDDPDAKIWGTAVSQLTYRFADAPGVTEAFRALLDDAEKRPAVLRYLSRRDPSVTLPPSQTEPTLQMRAQQSLKNGDTAAARAAFFQIIDGETEPKYTYAMVSAARDLMPLIQSESDKSRLRRALVARLQISSEYSSVAEIIGLLRQLPAPENVEVLLTKLAPPTQGSAAFSAYMWHKPARAATFALLDLGADARKRGAAQVVTLLRNNAAISDNAATIAACELAWLADDATWQNTARFAPAIARQIAQLQPLRNAVRMENEARSLAVLLPDAGNRWQNRSDGWIIARLGELGDGVAVAPLLAELKRAPYAARDEDFRLALVQIGGASARNGALELLSYPEPSQRALGMDVLRELPDFDARPLLLKTLASEDVPDKTHAIFLLGYVGTPQDLPVLTKLADFWTTDLAYHSRAVNAVNSIRLRYPADE